MTTPSLSLEDLARHIARQENELDRLRQEFEARRVQLDELSRRKQELESQLQQVESEIQGLATGSLERPAAAPAKRRRARRGQGLTLSDLIVNLVTEAGGQPLSVQKLAREVVRRKFPTTSRNVPGLVQTRVGELVRKGVLRRTAGRLGVVLGTAPNSQPAVTRPRGPARGKGKKAGPRGRTARRPAPGRRQGQPSLREVITEVLRESRQPLGSGQLAQKILATGYKTSSKDFPGVVSVALTKMPNLEKVPGRGFRLKKGAG
jgi:hypothetical protein